MGSFNSRGQLDVLDGRIIVCQGKKRSGKSIMAGLFAMSYPGDLVVLDIAGDDGPTGKHVIDLSGTVDDIARRWPEERREGDARMVLRYVPDPGSPTFLDDMDAVVGLALHHGKVRGRCALLVHEMGVLAKVHQTRPHTRRALMHNRHHKLTMILCMPRSKVVDPLVLGQADLVYTFTLPNPDDRQRTAETIGWDPAELSEAVHGVPWHGYIRYDANEDAAEPPAGADPTVWEREHPDMRLVEYPPLPAEDVRRVQRWYADGR